MAAGITGFALVPTVPPWMASELFGFLPKLVHFNIKIYNAVAPGLTTGFNTNPVAAMPSLHAAFPILCSLIVWTAARGRSWPFHVYTLLILFTIVYTGDHYIVDIMAGGLLAAASFLAARKLGKKMAPGPGSASGRNPGSLNRSLAAGGALPPRPRHQPHHRRPIREAPRALRLPLGPALRRRPRHEAFTRTPMGRRSTSGIVI
jgi:hypothetical protein